MHLDSKMTAIAPALLHLWCHIVSVVNWGPNIAVWQRWPGLRALLQPRLRLACHGLTALLESSNSLDDEDVRWLLKAVHQTVIMASSIAVSIHNSAALVVEDGATHQHGEGVALVFELAQVLVVQPQFLNMVKAGIDVARRHLHLNFSHISSVTVAECLNDITKSGMETLCLLHYTSPLDPSSPKLQHAMLNCWCTAALEMLKVGGMVRGQWPAGISACLINYGLSIPLSLLGWEVQRQGEAGIWSLPLADRPRYLKCALAAEEWLLSAADGGIEGCDWELANAWSRCYGLAALLVTGGPPFKNPATGNISDRSSI